MARWELVDSEALDRLIAYADDVREQRDHEFVTRREEHEESAAELAALVAGLRRNSGGVAS